MQISPFTLIAPHYCCSCGEIGALLCEYCKYNIESESLEQCIVCERLVSGNEALCKDCDVPYAHAWCVGKKSDELERLITAYKFSRAKAAYRSLAQLLAQTVPALPPDTIVTAVPTVAAHIRERGYDHAELIARQFAQLGGYEYRRTLKRLTTARQRGATRREREAQAKVAFGPVAPLTGTYLLVDDVLTTGATLKYAAGALLAAGAKEVWVGVIARQPLE